MFTRRRQVLNCPFSVLAVLPCASLASEDAFGSFGKQLSGTAGKMPAPRSAVNSAVTPPPTYHFGKFLMIDTRLTNAWFMCMSLGLFHLPGQTGGTDTSSFKQGVTATVKNPTLIGVVVHWITSYVTAGQYMDRPDPQLVVKNAGTLKEVLANTSYTLHFLWVRLWYPLLRFRMRLSQGRKRAVDDNIQHR
jgi:hypothetical protein